MRHIYAKIETNFFHDARFRSMTEGERLAYLAVWLLSVEVGNACLSPEASTSTYLSTRANVHPRSVQSMVKKASTFSQPLLKVREDGGLTVCGVTKLHPKVVRFDEGIQEKRREENIKKKEEKRTEPETGKDLPLALSDQDLQKAKALWEKHYGATSDQTTASIVKMLEDGGLDRTMYAIRECTKKPRQVPIAFARKVFNETEHRNKRKPEMVPIGDILAAKLEHAT